MSKHKPLMRQKGDEEMDIKETAKQIHEWAISKGWWEHSRSIGDQFANFHSEISEAWEEHRNGHDMNEVYHKDGKPEGVPIELADAVIRIFDTCEAYGIDLEAAITEKMEYNKTRPYRHGGKRA